MSEEIEVLKIVTGRLERADLADRIAHLGLDGLPRGEPMKDASPEIERRYLEMLRQCPGEDRLLMGDSMYATAHGHQFDPHTRGRTLASLGGERRSPRNAAAPR